MNDHYIDISYRSLHKKGEELCGDKVEIFKSKERSIVVLADGLGSGVKANILSTLTSKIAITMLKEGASIESVIDTIIHTLPVCKVRGVAYSTFSIIEIDDELNCRIFESENPPFFFIRDGKIVKPANKTIRVHGKKVIFSSMKLKINDIIYLCSDGVIHAGVGEILNYGWQWSDVAKFMECDIENNAQLLSHNLVDACNSLYSNKPGDDTTVVAIKIRKPVDIMLFTGPPINRDVDDHFAKMFMSNRNCKKIVCGGTASNIMSNYLGKPIESDFNYIDKDIPPIGNIEGIDLVTEGVITINRTIQMLETWMDSPYSIDLRQKDGATLLFNYIVDDATTIVLWVGKANNEAHQVFDFPSELSIKINIVNKLVDAIRKIGKDAEVNYISEVDYEKI